MERKKKGVNLPLPALLDVKRAEIKSVLQEVAVSENLPWLDVENVADIKYIKKKLAFKYWLASHLCL